MTDRLGRLALGTVQFGLRYGVANTSGQVSPDEAAAIVAHGREAGLRTLDTAMAYGDSERRLGEIGVTDWEVVSKIPPVPADCADIAAWVDDCVRASLARLGVTTLKGVLLHRAADLAGPQGARLYAAMAALKQRGAVTKIGVSIYGPEELEALDPDYRLDLVQAPFNVVDRRLVVSGSLTRLLRAGTEVHCRSAFLQGLLLMASPTRPPVFQRWQSLWDRWHQWLEEQSLTPLQACLGFVLAQPGIARVVVGVDSLAQFEEILAAARTPSVCPPSTLMSSDLDLIDPSRWRTQ